MEGEHTTDEESASISEISEDEKPAVKKTAPAKKTVTKPTMLDDSDDDDSELTCFGCDKRFN